MINELQLNSSCTFVEVALQGEIFKLRSWGAGAAPRGIALLVHGLGAHSAWFEAAAREFAARGFSVLAYDQRGFGERSAAAFSSYRQWIDDLAALVKQIRQDHSGVPLYLMGNSMGALVVMAASRQLDVDGIVIFSPGFDGHPEAFSFSYKFKTIMSALLTPQKDVKLPYRPDFVTRDLGVREWLSADPLKRLAVPGVMLLELLKLSQNVIANLKSVHVPVLMMTAGQERVVNNQVNEKLFARLSAPSKKHVCMKDAWHDLMFDPQVDEVAAELAAWHDSLVQSPVCNSRQ